MSKYLVTKLVSGRFIYYFQGVDAFGKQKWNGLISNGNEYGKITAIEIKEKLSMQFKSDEYDIQPTQN